LSGRLGKDPEMKYLPNGNSVASATLATSNDYKPKDGGDWVKKPASWHRLTAFGKTAEMLCEYRKGDKLTVEGKITYTEWTDKEGVKKTSTEIQVFQVVQPERKEAAPADLHDDNIPF
jgi:single-strand DNA-binding protein